LDDDAAAGATRRQREIERVARCRTEQGGNHVRLSPVRRRRTSAPCASCST
jgi:hypothetical protein